MSLARIAAALGLSVTTVSRALGGYADVSAATRQRVREEAERLGYRANASARRLRAGVSDAIGVILPTGPGQLEDAFFLRLLGSIGPRLAAAGLDLMVGAARPGAEEMALYRHLVDNHRVDGFLVARARRQDPRVGFLLDRGVPFVLHGRTEEARPYAYVDVDGAAAFRQATERLLGFGHRCIGLINAPGTYSFAQAREAGWRGALEAAGLPPGPRAEAVATEENGFRLAQAMLRGRTAPTALLCATDRLAVGVLHALAAAELRAARDVSVLGYDNLSFGTFTDPPLTTFEPRVDDAAERMVGMLVALLRGAPPAGMAEILAAQLVARSSDGPAPAAGMRRTQRRKQAPSKGEAIHGNDTEG
ncbi:substrate-binding domain-containing protein [Roseomonas sp. OT10]|uniref:substrate-binding domain-containing protein n=1 Tax=Roseomonas cutis TaxID=2897332 RepID=UPI001E634250|nr:substrate-binding domain-containing protein [Roseomonas sp. OT10]UFN47509.1 substrate-binding domain-containing protein [Roseomonas sp. OT10]